TKGPGQPIEIQIVHRPKNVGAGITSGNSATCPACGYTTPVSHVREQLRAKNGGSSDPLLLAVVTQTGDRAGKKFRSPDLHDQKAINAVADFLSTLEKAKSGGLPLIPAEDCPPDGALGFRFQKYGITRWRDLYSPRQLVTLCTFTRILASAELQKRME